MVTPPATGVDVLRVEVDWRLKSSESEPWNAMELIVKAAFPLLVRVTEETEEAALRFTPPKDTVPGASAASGAVPVPVRKTVCALPVMP